MKNKYFVELIQAPHHPMAPCRTPSILFDVVFILLWMNMLHFNKKNHSKIQIKSWSLFIAHPLRPQPTPLTRSLIIIIIFIRSGYIFVFSWQTNRKNVTFTMILIDFVARVSICRATALHPTFSVSLRHLLSHP